MATNPYTREDVLREAKEAEEGIGLYVEWHGGIHDDGCSEDNTCDCSGKPRNDGLNNGVAKLLQLARDYAALMALEALDQRAQTWRPIETAPVNTAVLVACAHGLYVACNDERIFGAGIFGWSVDDNKHGPYALRGASPTHWMPLPVAPCTAHQPKEAK